MALVWKNGKRVEADSKELADQLRFYAERSREEFGYYSDWRGIIGERFEEAAKEIERLIAR